MAKKIERFEDLDCWKSARQLMKLVIQACDQCKLQKDYEMRSQLKRAALSAMNNIAEGFGRHTDKEFIRFLDMSQGSSIEVKSMTFALEDSCYPEIEQILLLRRKAEETKAITLGLIRYLRNKG